jgi:uncharacterized metal-binding protein
MKERKLGPGKTRKELEETGKRLAFFTAERVLDALRDGLALEGFEPVEELQHAPPSDENISLPTSCCPVGMWGDSAENSEPSEVEACPVSESGEQLSGGKYKVKSVTILPCQGIKRSGGRVTQRTAYHIAEDRYLGKSNLLCISALAAGVQEDVDMLEKFPTIAINGCQKRCASIAAEHYGVPAVASVDLHKVDPSYACEEYCFEPDLTEKESATALKLADAVSVEMEKFVGQTIDWQTGNCNLHGLVHRASTLNKATGYADAGKGFLVKLAKYRATGGLPTSAAAGQILSLEKNSASEKISAEENLSRDRTGGQATSRTLDSVESISPTDTGLQTVVTNLFKPRKPQTSKKQGVV